MANSIPLPSYETVHSGNYIVLKYDRELEEYYMYLPNKQSYELGETDQARRTLLNIFGLGYMEEMAMDCAVNFSICQVVFNSNRIIPLISDKTKSESEYLNELLSECEEKQGAVA